MPTVITSPKPRLLPRLLLAGLAVLACAGSARAWWDEAWSLRKPFTIDTSAGGVPFAGPLGPVPVLVRLHDGNFRFADAAADGSDLRFVAADDQTLLSYHIEKYDPLLNEAFVWVKIPAVAAGAKTTFWLYYGNAAHNAARAADAKATYDADTFLVYHFGEPGQAPVDSSAARNHAQNAGTTADGALIASGLRFDGKGVVTIPAAPSLAWSEGTPLTWSAWLRFPAVQLNAVVFSRWDGSNAFVIGVDNGVPFVEVTTAAGTQRSSGGARLAPNAWHHVAVVADAAKLTLYVEGEVYGSLPRALPALNSPAFLGGDGPIGAMGASGDRVDFLGEIDELQIAHTARPAEYLKFAAVEQAGGEGAARLLVAGEDEQPTNWLSGLKTGYIGVIIGSLTVDGWVVIGLLFVMALISWCVMIGKAVYLNRISKGNAQFLREWRRVASDLSVLDDGDTEQAKALGGQTDAKSLRVMRGAPLYRIYHLGVEEIRHRVGPGQGGGDRIISARAIQAIRATLDGGLVRETQRLNSQMVLLTIAISGGPFLGLLGTVVGVMITFAAVAQAGDVNVNAIAPGIAAALAATVAGLAVAIPSLFGYNYLLTRAKSASSDMHVFIDEFVTRMAEFYSEPAK